MSAQIEFHQKRRKEEVERGNFLRGGGSKVRNLIFTTPIKKDVEQTVFFNLFQVVESLER